MEFLNQTLFALNDRTVTPLVLLWALVAFALVMGLALVAAGYMRKRLFGRGHGNPSTERSVIRAWLAGAAVFGLVVALRVVGFRPGGVFVLLGLFALAIALAARHALADCIAGLVLLYERSLSVGDHVQIGTDHGEIEAIRLKSTYITTTAGARLVVPNALLRRTPVTNFSAPDGRIRLCLPVVLAHGSDAGEAIMVLKKVAERNARVRKNPAPRALMTGIDPAGLRFELWAWAGDPSDAPYVANELYRGIQSELARARIRLAGTETGHGRPPRDHARPPVPVEDVEAPRDSVALAQPSRSPEPSRDGEGGGPRRERSRSRRSRRDGEGAPPSRGRGDRAPEPREEPRRPEPPVREEQAEEPEFSFEPSSEPPRAAGAPLDDFYLGDPAGGYDAVSTTPPPEPEERSGELPAEAAPAPEQPKPQTFGRGKRKLPRR